MENWNLAEDNQFHGNARFRSQRTFSFPPWIRIKDTTLAHFQVIKSCGQRLLCSPSRSRVIFTAPVADFINESRDSFRRSHFFRTMSLISLIKRTKKADAVEAKLYEVAWWTCQCSGNAVSRRRNNIINNGDEMSVSNRYCPTVMVFAIRIATIKLALR